MMNKTLLKVVLLGCCLLAGQSLAAVSFPIRVAAAPAGATTNSVQQIVGGDTYTWNFTCDGGACLYGEFIGGDYWIAPKTAGEAVVLTSVTTTGTAGGLEVNPSTTGSQGFIVAGGNYAASGTPGYSAALNKTNSLPLTVAINSTLVKATSRTTRCNPSGATICVASYGTLTVLPSGSYSTTTFRPTLAGSTKTLYTLADFDLTKIPSDSRVNAALKSTPSWSTIHTRWHNPVVDHYIKNTPLGGLGDAGRAMIPTAIANYGAQMATDYLQDLISVMGTHSINDKQTAITGLIQRGIDLYGSYKAGVTWPGGAGQSLGRKAPVAFFATMLTATTIRTEISTVHQNNADYFQEDGQVKINVATGNVPVWGDELSGASTVFSYWSQLYSTQSYNDHPKPIYPAGDNQRTLADPYGYIDGPAGEPASEYIACCSVGPMTGYQVAQAIMPALCTANNDAVFSTFVVRARTSGVHTSPDSCAPPDVRESASCTPYNWSTSNHRNCLYFTSEATISPTWGPVLDGNHKPTGACIQNNSGTNTGQTGRYSLLHGRVIGSMPGHSLGYKVPVAETLLTNVGLSLLSSCAP